MLRGYYTAANGIINEQRILNVISNNIANVKTAGFKTDTAVPTTFNESLLLIKGKPSQTGTIRYRTIDYTKASLNEGTYENTGSRLDLALKGPVHFNIQSYQNGEVLLTRNGQFSIDAEGYLALGSDGRVLDNNQQPIQIGTSDFVVSKDGTIATDDGRTFTLGLTYLPADANAEKIGENTYRPYDEEVQTGNIPEDTNFTVMQGIYERSNVDITDEILKSTTAQGVFNACTSALKIINSVNQITCNNLAKIN